MKAEPQLTLDLGHRPAMGREDFLVTPGNALAVAWIDRWPDWPGPALAIYGAAGSGKTHLAEVWRRRSGAARIEAASLSDESTPALVGPGICLVLEDLEHALVGNAALQEAVLHLYNATAEGGGHLLLIGQTPPVRWDCALADLRSRLGSVQAVGLQPPDDGLIEALLLKLFHDRQLRVSPEVLRFIVARVERSCEAVQRLVAQIDQASLASRRPVTVPLVRDLLGAERTTSD